jgi:hypothetical protein
LGYQKKVEDGTVRNMPGIAVLIDRKTDIHARQALEPVYSGRAASIVPDDQFGPEPPGLQEFEQALQVQRGLQLKIVSHSLADRQDLMSPLAEE